MSDSNERRVTASSSSNNTVQDRATRARDAYLRRLASSGPDKTLTRRIQSLQGARTRRA